MHEYYKNKSPKLKKEMNSFLKLISSELEQDSGKRYSEVFEEIWKLYEERILEILPYIGGDDVSGTKNLTGAYYFVAMGEVMKEYGVGLERIGELMTLSYARWTESMPGIVKPIIGKIMGSPKMLNKMFEKRNRKNAENALKNPGSFETETMNPPEAGYDFSYHNLVCPLSNFAKEHGYEEYMPYLCNLDYVMFGILGVPLYRERTFFEDGDYCDFKLKAGAKTLEYWPPVFRQDNPYK